MELFEVCSRQPGPLHPISPVVPIGVSCICTGANSSHWPYSCSLGQDMAGDCALVTTQR